MNAICIGCPMIGTGDCDDCGVTREEERREDHFADEDDDMDDDADKDDVVFYQGREDCDD